MIRTRASSSRVAALLAYLIALTATCHGREQRSWGEAQTDQEILGRARALHQRAITIDSHTTPSALVWEH